MSRIEAIEAFFPAGKEVRIKRVTLLEGDEIVVKTPEDLLAAAIESIYPALRIEVELPFGFDAHLEKEPDLSETLVVDLGEGLVTRTPRTVEGHHDAIVNSEGFVSSIIIKIGDEQETLIEGGVAHVNKQSASLPVLAFTIKEGERTEEQVQEALNFVGQRSANVLNELFGLSELID
jgi:hypothetical protein